MGERGMGERGMGEREWWNGEREWESLKGGISLKG